MRVSAEHGIPGGTRQGRGVRLARESSRRGRNVKRDVGHCFIIFLDDVYTVVLAAHIYARPVGRYNARHSPSAKRARAPFGDTATPVSHVCELHTG